mgnify:CR=1 FL=1
MRKKTLAVTALLVAAVVGFTACSGGDGSDDQNPSGDTNLSDSGAGEQASGDSEESAGGASGGEEAAFGETITIESGDRKYAITVTGPREADIDTSTQQEGETYVAFDVEIEALEGKAFAGANDFHYVSPDGEAYPAQRLLLTDDNNEELLSMSGPDEGETTSGALVFEVPSDHEGYVVKFETIGVGGDKPSGTWS